MLDNFITTEFISTLSGCVTVTVLLTQFTKDIIDRYIPKTPTKYVCFVYALLTILVFQISTKVFSLNNIYITLINAILVAFTSIGSYEAIIKPFTNSK